jgi:hypothetical protein
MSDDLYVHHHLKTNGAQEKNLIALARYLVTNSAAIDARQGLLFGLTTMRRFRPLPADIVGAPEIPMPPLAYGPLAGVAPKPGDDWRSYVARSFCIQFEQPFIHWLQAAPWQETEGSAMGAALRIAYVLDYGVPHDYREIAEGKAGTDYDDNGFLWDKLDMLPPGYTGGPWPKLRVWPSRGDEVEGEISPGGFTVRGKGKRETR